MNKLEVNCNFCGIYYNYSCNYDDFCKKGNQYNHRRMSNEQAELALWLEEDAETYELTFVPIKVADKVSDYFTYVEDSAGNRYMITLPYDYILSTTSASDNGIKVEHD